MNVAKAVASRRSVRAFLDKPVPFETLAAAIETAGWAASSGNLQPWRVHALTGEPLEALKAKIAPLIFDAPADPPRYPIYPSDLDETYRGRLTELVQGIFAREGVAPGDAAQAAAWSRKHFHFFGAPVGLFVYIDAAMGACQWIDIGAYLQNLMLLLSEQGLATCAEAAWSLWWRPVGEFLGETEARMLVCGLAVGYADPDAPINGLKTSRASLEAFADFRGFPQ
jgi:nitroreductase